jgi:hypothetical protein
VHDAKFRKKMSITKPLAWDFFIDFGILFIIAGPKDTWPHLMLLGPGRVSFRSKKKGKACKKSIFKKVFSSKNF